MKELDISSESERAYHYAEGRTFSIDSPKTLFITDTGSHRVVANDGRTYRPERGWLAISWLPRAGAPAFVA